MADIVAQAEQLKSVQQDQEIIPAVPFPLHVFPLRYQHMAESMAKAFNIEAEIVVCNQLPILGAALGNAIRIAIKKDWKEPPFIWLVVVAPTGYGKSPVLSMLVQPVEVMEAKNTCITSDPNDPDKINFALYSSSYIVSDTTVEALADIFEASHRGVLIKVDELAGLMLGMNQYKGTGNDKQHYLELFNCNSWKINRKGSSRFIRNTGASIIGGIQPEAVKKAFGEGSVSDGLIPRFLYVLVDSKPRRYSRHVVESEDILYWTKMLEYFYGIPLGFGENGFLDPITLVASAKAEDGYEAYYNQYEEAKEELSGVVCSFIPKLHSYCIRLAGILHAIDCYDRGADLSEEISEETLEKAVKLTDYFAGQTVRMASTYCGGKKPLDEQQKRLIEVLKLLGNQARNGQLAISMITQLYNRGLSRDQELNPKNIGSLLHSLDLKTKKSTGNLSFLIWENTKMRTLLQQSLI
jgi:hypothetical protein